MVLDFFEIDRLMLPIIASLDHKYLNDIPGLENPTAEHIAAWIFKELPRKDPFSITVWETEDCWATFVNADGLFPRAHKE
jgi:6-pyruvoyltetrahydropterin/6-carboxytetrahydropterin synthase